MAQKHPLAIEWGQNIKEQRTNPLRRWTQAELAEKVGVSAAAVSYWESGDRMPDDRKKARIAAVFGVSPRMLFPIQAQGNTERAA